MIEKFWLFHCAYARIPRAFIVGEGGWRLVRLPFLCGVAEHREKGLILFDAPYGHEGPSNVGKLMGTMMRRTALVFREGWSVIPRLEQLELRPADVGMVCLTHLHYDHTGALKTLAHSRFHLSQIEWDAAHEGSSSRAGLKGYAREDFSALQHRMIFHDAPTLTADTDTGLDLLGDGSIEMFMLPGHTTGHCGYRIRLTSGKTIFFAGDAGFTVDQLRGKETLGFFPRSVAANTDQAEHTLNTIGAYLRNNPDHIPITCHDLELGRQCIKNGPISFE